MKEQVVNEIVATLKNSKDRILSEAVQLMGNGITSYVRKNVNEIAYVKTFLNRTSPRHIEQVYYPLRISKGTDEILVKDVRGLFANSKYITIKGDAGSGKSTLMKYVLVNALTTSFYLPLFIKLRDFGDYDSFEDMILVKMVESSLCADRKIAERLLKKGCYLLLLDGLDELSVSIGNRAKKEINNFVEKYHLNHYVLTSRPYSQIDLLSVFDVYELRELTDEEINEFIVKSVEQSISEKIINSINLETQEHHKSFLRSPLLLSLYLLTYRNYSTLPKSKKLYYRRVVDVLFCEHDSISKPGYSRDYASKLDQEEIEKVLEIFSFITHFNEQYVFSKDQLVAIFGDIKRDTSYNFNTDNLLYDLTSSASIWTNDDGEYSYVHKSIQEYFAAIYFSRLSEDRKKVIYDMLTKQYMNDSVSSNNNLMVLYSEIDEHGFLLNVLKPIYLEHLNKIGKKDLYGRIKALFDNNIFRVEFYGSTGSEMTIHSYRKMYIHNQEFDMNRLIDHTFRFFHEAGYEIIKHYLNDDHGIKLDKFIKSEIDLFKGSDLDKFSLELIGYLEEVLRKVDNLESQQSKHLNLLDFIRNN